MKKSEGKSEEEKEPGESQGKTVWRGGMVAPFSLSSLLIFLVSLGLGIVLAYSKD